MIQTRKRCIHTVDLRFFQDDATGEWGLTHKDTKESVNGTDGFNAFWDGRGIFHDVFEHAHEFTNKYFKGDYAMNIGGEMAAMGAMWYYYSELGVTERLNPTSIYSPGEMMRHTTEMMVTEAIGEGYCQFGERLESNVPRQRPVGDSELEYQIEELYKNARKYRKREYNLDRPKSESEIEEIARNKQYGEEYRRSVTKRKVADLHRYGYRMAQKLIPFSYENRHKLEEFIQFFDKFCKRNKAEELAQLSKGMIVKIYRDSNGLISWKAFLQLNYGASKSLHQIGQFTCCECLYRFYN